MAERIERDTMGEMKVPEDALYGAQTARAVLNFPISGTGIGRSMIRAIGSIKACAAQVNNELGSLDDARAHAITEAAQAVARGEYDEHFPVDVFQTGSGTSSNMNANEVIARLATRALDGVAEVHPNDHVNLGQSSNDVFPTAIHLAALSQIEEGLLPALQALQQSLATKGEAFRDVVTTGRTHLQDATPIRYDQVFSGYSTQVEHGYRHLRAVSEGLRELAIGGTAVGTGLNTHPDFGAHMASRLGTMYETRLHEAENHFEAQSARDAAVRCSGALKSIAASLIKIANDIRWLASGPRLGLGELHIPPVQPGSSIMPGKINPVIAESLIQVGAQVIGNDAAIAVGGMYGHFQLNVMMPLIARNLLEQIELLSKSIPVFRERLVHGLDVRRESVAGRLEQSLALATALAPHVGYERAAQVAKRAEEEGRTVAEIVTEEGLFDPDTIAEILDPARQTTNRDTESESQQPEKRETKS